MKPQNVIVGLDIGTTKIACFVGVRDGEDKVKVVGYGVVPSIGVENGVIRNVARASETIKDAVNSASRQAATIIEEVYVGIAGQHIRSKTSPGSISVPSEHYLITEEDLERLEQEQYNVALDPGEKIIHVFPQQYFIDKEPVSSDSSPIGMPGKTLAANFHVVTANSENLNHIHLAIKMAGLTVKGVVLEPIASALAVLDSEDKYSGIALVDIGGGTTDIAVFKDGTIRHTQVLPIAGNIITDDIQKECNILPKYAKKLKEDYGSCLEQAVPDNEIISVPSVRNIPPKEIYKRHLAAIINRRVRMIAEQIEFEIQKSGIHEQLIFGISLTGGGSQLKNIDDLTSLITSLHTNIGTPDVHLSKDSVDYASLVNPAFSTVIGLLLFGLEKQENSADDQAETETISVTGHVNQETKDILSQLDDMPDSEVKPQVEPEKPKKKKREGLIKFGEKLTRIFFNDDIDEE